MNLMPILITVVISAVIAGAIAYWVYKVRIPRDLNVPHRLGEAMGLEQLNEGSRHEPTWYGGRFQDHDFAFTYVNLQYSSYAGAHERTFDDVILSLRLAIEVKVPKPQEIIAYFHHGRRHEPGLFPESFEAGFDHANTDKLSPAAKNALLFFAQNHGSLRLRDRASAPQSLFAANALPDSRVVLVHDRPGHKQSPDEINQILEALLLVSQVLEDSHS